MRLLLPIGFILHFCAFGQPDYSKSFTYTILPYQIVDRDTISVVCTQGIYGESDYKKYDSTWISAHIIFPTLPMNFNKEFLQNRIIDIMTIENIQDASVWRDTKALWMIPFSFRSKEMIEQQRKSCIGTISTNDNLLRLHF